MEKYTKLSILFEQHQDLSVFLQYLWQKAVDRTLK